MEIHYDAPGMLRLWRGDVLAALGRMEPEGAQCCVTSPPYWGLRDYGLPPTEWPEVTFTPMAGLPPVTVPAWSGCLGLEPDPLAFVAHLVHVFRQVHRVLKDSGTVWLNLGDTYASTGGAGWQGKHGARANRTHTQRNLKGKSSRGPVKNKDLLGIPWRVAFALQADGWYLRSDVIWHKPNPMPESVTDRPTKAHEYVFLLVKSEHYAYDAEAIKEPDGGAPAGNGFAGRQGRSERVGPQDGGRGSEERWQPGSGRNTRSVWPIATQPYNGAHFATMPPALAERCILAGSRSGDTVLDPFNGAGTTGLVCLRYGRRFVGIDLNPGYCKLAVVRWRSEFSLFLPTRGQEG